MRGEDIELRVARTEAKRLAHQILELDCELGANERDLAGLVQISEAAPLLQETGFGAVSAAKCLGLVSLRKNKNGGRICVTCRG